MPTYYEYPKGKRTFLRSNQPPRCLDNSLYTNRIPLWYEDMTVDQRLSYQMNFPQTKKKCTIPKDYVSETEANDWVLNKGTNGELYFQHSKYGDKKYTAIKYCPKNSDIIQYIPSINRSEDIYGLGYMLISKNGLYSEIVSNKWYDLVEDTRYGKRIQNTNAYKIYRKEKKNRSIKKYN